MLVGTVGGGSRPSNGLTTNTSCVCVCLMQSSTPSQDEKAVSAAAAAAAGAAAAAAAAAVSADDELRSRAIIVDADNNGGLPQQQEQQDGKWQPGQLLRLATIHQGHLDEEDEEGWGTVKRTPMLGRDAALLIICANRFC